MNIRDVKLTKEELEEVLESCILTKIFEKQTELIEKYEPIEKQNGHISSKWPWDIHTFEGQRDCRDQVFRITEELFEHTNTLRNKAWKTTHVLTDEDHFLEELMDAFHFLVEYFIKLGLTPMDIYVLYMKKNKVNRFRQNSDY